MTILKQENKGAALGVDGRFHNVIAWPETACLERCRGRIANQQFTATRYHKDGRRLTVTVRFDDNCKNGHETLSITAQLGTGNDASFGCLHDEIAETFPEFAPLIPYHLCSTDGPMHYEANTVYLAGNRDHDGLLKGQPSNNPVHYKNYVRFGNSPIEHKVSRRLRTFIEETIADDGEFIVDKVDHVDRDGYEFGPKFQFAGMDCKWHDCPFDTCEQATQWAEAVCGPMEWSSRTDEFGKGKERELDAARRAAIWPDATDEQLSSEPQVLEGLLIARKPALMETFRQLIEGFGFLYGAPVEA